jgi:hypothetical protein
MDTDGSRYCLKEQSYNNFVKEVLLWKEWGHTSGEISALLVRIYKEQSGGGALAAIDRKQRRKSLKITLTRLRDDEVGFEEMRQLAVSTLSEFERVL